MQILVSWDLASMFGGGIYYRNLS